jgi:hypothetical protein
MISVIRLVVHASLSTLRYHSAVLSAQLMRLIRDQEQDGGRDARLLMSQTHKMEESSSRRDTCTAPLSGQLMLPPEVKWSLCASLRCVPTLSRVTIRNSHHGSVSYRGGDPIGVPNIEVIESTGNVLRTSYLILPPSYFAPSFH